MIIDVHEGPASEPLTIAEVMAHLRMDEGNQEPAPTAPTVAIQASPSAGNVDNGLHRYLVTFVTADGETQAGTSSAAATVVDRTINGKVSVTDIPVGGAAVTARRLYRTAAGGAVWLALATIADNTTTVYLDNVADASLGAGAPAGNTTDDPALSSLIEAARKEVEYELKRCLVTQTLDAYFDGFPCDQPMHLKLQPLQSVTSITYIDSNGDEQVLADTQYKVDAKSKPARIAPAYGCTWPSTRDEVNAVKVRFVAGYGAPAAVPKSIKQWMLLRIGSLWQNRATQIVDGRALISMPPSFASGLLDVERVWGRT